MPLPLAVGAAIVVSALTTFAYNAMESAYDYIKKWMWVNRKRLAIKAIKEWLGIDETSWYELSADDDFSLDEAEITKAINQKLDIKASIGIEFSNVFSRDAIKADINKLALARVNFLLGADPENPIIESFNKDSMRANLRGFFGKHAVLAIENGSSGFIGAADVSRIVDAAMTYERHYEKYKADPARPVINTPAAASNRSRQAKYRANHTRHWEPK
jgi:hypothetical protein